MNPAGYRNDDDTLVTRRDWLVMQRREQLVKAKPLHRIAARKWAAILGGATATLGWVATGLVLLYRRLFIGPRNYDGTATTVLLASWVIAAVVYLATYLWMRARRHSGQPRVTLQDVRYDLTVLEAWDPIEQARKKATYGLRASLGLPLMGVLLLFPLTIHYGVALLAFGGSTTFADFDKWIIASFVLVGHSHLVLAGLGWHYAGKLVTGLNQTSWLGDALTTLFITAVSSVIPTIIFGPVLVVLTGIVPVPVMYWLVHKRARHLHQILRAYS